MVKGMAMPTSPTAAQRVAYHEAARVHSIPALVAWVLTVAASAASFLALLATRSEA